MTFLSWRQVSVLIRRFSLRLSLRLSVSAVSQPANRRGGEAQRGTAATKAVLVEPASRPAELGRRAMLVVTERGGAANSEGVRCSGPFSIAKRFIECVTQQIGTSRSYGAKPHCSVDGYKHSIPTGFFVQLNNLRKITRMLRLATQRHAENRGQQTARSNLCLRHRRDPHIILSPQQAFRLVPFRKVLAP